MVYSARAVGRSVVKLSGPWSLHRRHRPTEVDKDVRGSGASKVFTIFTQTIMHLITPPPPPPAPPPKKKKTLHNHCFRFLLGMVMQNSEGENKVHYGLYESSDYKRCKVCVKLSYLTDNLVPRSPRSCAGLRK